MIKQEQKSQILKECSEKLERMSQEFFRKLAKIWKENATTKS